MKHFLLFLLVAVSMCAQAPTPAPDPSTVVGTIGGKDVTLAEIQKLMGTSEPGFAGAFLQNPGVAVTNLLVYQFLSAEAERRKLAEQSPTKEQIETAVTRMLREAVVNDERNNYPVSNEQLDSYYNEHKAQFQQTKIKVIYLAYKSDAPLQATSEENIRAAAQNAIGIGQQLRSEAEAKALATEIVKKLREGVLDFSKAVEQYSEDLTSKASGGNYGVIKIDSPYSEDFRKTVLALKPGQISDPLRQPAGYYIIRGEETSTQPMTEVLSYIVDAIRKDHMNQFMQSVNERFLFVPKDPKLLQNMVAPAGAH